jgi:hypothetical protein
VEQLYSCLSTPVQFWGDLGHPQRYSCVAAASHKDSRTTSKDVRPSLQAAAIGETKDSCTHGVRNDPGWLSVMDPLSNGKH